jgi:hypothetical protein
MFGLSLNPVGWWESAINGKMEREFADLLLGTALSMLITFLCRLRKFPVIGPALADASQAGRLNMQNFKDGAMLKKFSITYPKEMDDPDWGARFVTISKES